MATKEKTPDSVTHTEERHAKLKEESARNERKQAETVEDREIAASARERKMKEDENSLLTQHANMMQPGESREQLLDRIRQMRENPPKEPPRAPFLSDFQKGQLQAEQEAGAAGVKRAEEEMERGRVAREQARKEQIKREGEMKTVHHPNPGQNEQYPAEKASLGKTRK